MRRWIPVAAIALGVASGCGGPQLYGAEYQKVRLTIQGTVVDGTTSAPVPGAAVALGSGGHFNRPSTLTSTSTNAAGQYSIRWTVYVYRGRCDAAQLWVQVEASGYQPLVGGSTAPLRPDCTEAVQRMDAALAKAS